MKLAKTLAENQLNDANQVDELMRQRQECMIEKFQQHQVLLGIR